jgi:hypothetical protein
MSVTRANIESTMADGPEKMKSRTGAAQPAPIKSLIYYHSIYINTVFIELFEKKLCIDQILAAREIPVPAR